jgi:hypothetical protein
VPGLFGSSGNPDNDGYDGDPLTNIEEYVKGTDPRYFDSDYDGMPDGWEVHYGFDPTDDTDSEDDVDNIDGGPDWLSNVQEYRWNTDPFDNDTDDDGLGDGMEVALGLNPNGNDSGWDIDGDGLNFLEELANGTDPMNPDTDNDSLPDGWEIKNDLDNDPKNSVGFNPLNSDTDGDGITDDLEDSDLDGLSSFDEYIWETSVSDADSDNDGIADGYDTDGDGMPDPYEIKYWLKPLVDDSKGDYDRDLVVNIDITLIKIIP